MGFTEGIIKGDRSSETISTALDSHWLMRHGAPAFLSADDEYNKGKLRSLLLSHYIVFKASPARRRNKKGKVERQIRTVREIIRKIDLKSSLFTPHQIVTRTVDLSNFFSGSMVLSSFQLARGYRNSILGISPTLCPPDLLSAHAEQYATRALQRAMGSNANKTLSQFAYKLGYIIWIWYKSSKGKEIDRQ